MPIDVVIAGAGPNGLMLACELSLAGVRPVVLERLVTQPEENRANGLVGQVVRVLDRRGLYQRLSGGTEPPQPTPGFVFGALPLNLSVLDDNPMYILPVPQRRLERELAARAQELGVEIRRGHELTGISQDGDGVDLEIDGPDGPYRLRTGWLAGADGGHSTTRKLSGIGFPGVTRDDSVSFTAHVSVPAELIDPATGGLQVPGYGLVPAFLHHRTERGLFVYAAFPSRPPMMTTVEWGPEEPEGAAPTLDDFRASVRRVLGVDVPFGPPEGEGPHMLRRLVGGNTRLADRFRDGRVLLVGDAAHVHSSIGGPGLNLGLQDTVNLGWKLAAEIHGWAPPGLLDTYDSERRPVSQRVVMHTQAQSALIAPGPEVTALRELFGELLTEPRVVRHIAALMSGTDIRYGYATPGDHPLAGRWAPDLLLETDGGTVRLAELTRNARPLLLDLTEDASLVAELAAWRGRVDIVAARVGTPEAPAALLLRPDCHVAWATGSARPSRAERDGLRAAAARWFGAAER
ncbi:FAD-dependent monooxygenase [Microbispora sp. RL4-1S]|uniref:FAD-dependent monooxygenase n=1 Tax=Microbispora oryzae TaxID=2806554 RepID=A0A941APH7_9ACTN|nr:FAD-dependent monooxygenase [Microbispora oryzae]MBP2703724.1 FAD-dependent monooxygenase [Microbispora oryzae]